MGDKIIEKLREYYRTLSNVPNNAQIAMEGLGRAAGQKSFRNMFQDTPSVDLQTAISQIYNNIVPRITNRAGWGEALNAVQPSQDPLQVLKNYFALKENNNGNRQ